MPLGISDETLLPSFAGFFNVVFIFGTKLDGSEIQNQQNEPKGLSKEG